MLSKKILPYLIIQKQCADSDDWETSRDILKKNKKKHAIPNLIKSICERKKYVSDTEAEVTEERLKMPTCN